MKARTDRFTEEPPKLSPRNREHSSEEERERLERKIEADKSLLGYFFRRQAWFSFSTLASTELCLPLEELERLGLIEPERRIRQGNGFRAGSKLYT